MHTNFSEGWDILERAREFEIDEKEILCTYVCDRCNNYDVSNFFGEKASCPFCGKKGGLSTVNPSNGVTELQLNEIYNFMDLKNDLDKNDLDDFVGSVTRICTYS